jgi:hypothetical protein
MGLPHVGPEKKIFNKCKFGFIESACGIIFYVQHLHAPLQRLKSTRFGHTLSVSF